MSTDELRDAADRELNLAVEALTVRDDHLAALGHTERASAHLRTLELLYRSASLPT